MKQSTKGGWVALAVISTLTLTKFILYWVSGSIAVLSEAWHSFADIATTLAVIFAIIRQQKKQENGQQIPAVGSDSENGEQPPAGRIRHLYNNFRLINSELKISALIGIVLLSAASMILYRAITAEPVELNMPLVTGIIFIALSFGSFFLYRFESSIGAAENSAALTADSHHNRADMVISLLTGISLIIYYFGTNLDRWVGIIIALYILAFSIELLANTVQSVVQKRDELVMDNRFNSIVQGIFQADTYRHLMRWLDDRAGIGVKTRRVLTLIPVIGRQVLRWGVRAGVASAVVAYLSSMLYSVNPDEQALVLRFGRMDSSRRVVQPGMHWKLPYPIDTVVRFQTGKVHALPVGNRSKSETAMIWSVEHGDNLTFISGDNNLFLPYVVIHYRIRNIYDYYLANRSGVPEKILAASSYRFMNAEFTRTSFYDLILNRREDWISSILEKLQQENDRLKTGLEIIDFCLKDLHPPIELAGSYEDVVAAGQMKETYLNNADRRVNSILSQSRMTAFDTVARAESYVMGKTKNAEGEAANYLLRYSGYKVGGELMKDMLLLKTAEKTLKGKRIVLVDPRSGIDKKLVYIEKNMSGRKNR